MGQKLNMKVNRLPVRTWNWLRMNESSLDQIEITDSCAVFTEGAAESAAAGKFDFSTIAAGMGKDMDRLAEREKNPPIRLCSTAGGKDAVKLHFVYESEQNSFQEVQVLAEEGSVLTVIMDYTSGKADQGLAAVRTRLRLEKDAKVRLIQIQLLGTGYAMLNDVGISCAEGASAEVVQLFLGSEKTYSGCQADLAGRGSGLTADIGYLGRNEQKYDMNYTAVHKGVQSMSSIRAIGALQDRSFKLFRGTIDFQTGSSESMGEEKEDVLLLSDEAVNQTIPLILCGEENVQGNHGATIGRLDEELLFYLCSRGMDRESACSMIVRARIEAVCQKIGDEEAQRQVQNYLEEAAGSGE